MYKKLVSEYSGNRRKKPRTSLFGKVLAFCHQNNLKKPESMNQAKIIKVNSEDQWHQEKMHFINNMVNESDIGKTIFWLKGKSIIDGYQITQEDVKQNQHFWQLI
jgi:hypothetical protein